MSIHDFSSHNQVKNEAISFYAKRMIFRPLARNDLSFRETVVGFITGLNFPRARSKVGSVGWPGERAG